jgi:hypothetical protein
MRIISLLIAPILAFAALPAATQAAEGASVRALLIIASNTKGGSDPKLGRYEETLRRNLPFESFRYAGEGSVSISGSGRATLSLARGHRLELDGEGGSGRGIRMKVRWFDGRREVMTTALVLQPGVPAVLARRGDEPEVPVVLVIAQ